MNDKEELNRTLISFLVTTNRNEILKLCTILGIPDGEIVMPYDLIDKTSINLVKWMTLQYGYDVGISKIVEQLAQIYEHNPSVKILTSLNNKIKKTSNLSREKIVISYDPKAIEQIKSKILTIVKEQKKYVETTEEIIKSQTVDYYHNLRDTMMDCSRLLLIISTSKNIKKCFEIVYSCAFFKQIPIDIYASERNKGDKGISQTICHIHEARKPPGKVIYYKDLDDLVHLINDRMPTLIPDYLKW